MTKNSTESLVSKPKRTIKPTAKIAPVLEEEEESSGPEDPRVRSNLQKNVDWSDNDGDGPGDDYEGNSGGDNNGDDEESSEGGADEDEEEEVVVVPQKRKKASQRTNKSILYMLYTEMSLASYQHLLQIKSLETTMPVMAMMK